MIRKITTFLILLFFSFVSYPVLAWEVKDVFSDDITSNIGQQPPCDLNSIDVKKVLLPVENITLGDVRKIINKASLSQPCHLSTDSLKQFVEKLENEQYLRHSREHLR